MLQGDAEDQYHDQVFKDLIDQIDLDGNGEIDFEEFEKMMKFLVRGKAHKITGDPMTT